MNCVKDGKYTGDSCFGCEIKVEDCEIRERVFRRRWIPVEERLPEVRINPITNDYVKYNVTYSSKIDGIKVFDVRQYGFGEASGNKHWLYSGKIMDNHVTAWMPLEEPYKG